MKHLIISMFLTIALSPLTQAQSCTPPSTIQSICGECKGGGGGSGENTGDFKIKDKSLLAKYGRVDAMPNVPKSLSKTLDQCWEDIRKLDQECNSEGDESVCQKSRKCMDNYHKIVNSFTRAHSDDLPESEDRHDQELMDKLQKETDPQNLATCADEESEKSQGLQPAEKTIDKLEKPNEDEFEGSEQPAPASGEFGPDVPGLKGGKGFVQDQGKRHRDLETPESDGPYQKAKEEKEKGKVSFLNFFISGAVANDSMEDSRTGFFGRLKDSIGSFFKGGGKAREQGAKSFDQGEYIAQNRVQTILARSGDQALKRNYQQFTEEKNHQTRLNNDVAGEGEAAIQERFSKNVDEQKKTNDELDKAIKAIAKICQNQQAEIKCWKTGNTPPPLPFPFGGGPAPEETPQEELEDWSELIKRSASYYCPSVDQPLILTAEEGIWHSGLILTPKGIVLTHLDPMKDYDFHPKGCLVRMPDPLDPENFEVYVSEPRFVEGISSRDNLIFLVPEAPHVENNEFLGSPEKDRKFPTILDYISQSTDTCAQSDLKMGTPLKLIGYNTPERFEKNRPVAILEALSTTFPSGEQKTMTAVVEAKDGMTGAILAHRDNQCFQGIARIKKVDEEVTIRDIIPLETIQIFVEEAVEVLNADKQES